MGSSVTRSAAFLFAGALLATAGVAHAQEAAPANPAQSASVGAELPWYQRFSASSGLTDTQPPPAVPDAPAWALSQRWGVTVDVREGQRLQGVDREVEPNQAAVGAYYQFTPRVRLGGELSVGEARNDSPIGSNQDDAETAAGVRIQSAFRF